MKVKAYACITDDVERERQRRVALYFVNIMCFSLVLSLFTVVQFANQGCLASSGENGTCLTEQECTSKGGIISGPCASNFGVCCLCKCYNNPFKPCK